ncbi:basic secretory protein-like protein [Galbibacter pacificus]|uniref:Basic secretory protein-like protein n=1 Tax=Galbibacter pacificus TaxID=2996052 RepID=A0ABT6FTA9_9FLAO|nr:basic secretory protein-like protein [Galbibacter pacificus]MDG3583009.1 basic secretory protein-like protein [Galbibacter pacificus]MDG3586490.1 basic secretory protein-like protein [Galbibacter pacificus]
MKIVKIITYIGIALALIPLLGHAQKSKIEILYVNQDKTLGNDLELQFKEIINTVYPKLLKKFNPKATKSFEVEIDTAYKGVAYASDNKIVVSADWMHKKPNDVDLMTHEIMHLIQAYPNNSGPSWLTEGIADYVRAVYGLNNKAANWSLPKFDKSQNYTNSYRVTARFLLWVEKNHDKRIVKKLDKHLRSHTYSESLWEKYTGLGLNQLWEQYAKDPII